MTAYVRVPIVDKRSRPVDDVKATPRAGRPRSAPQVQALPQAAASRQRLITVVSLAALVSSALAVVYANHLNRPLFIELQSLQTQRDAYQIEWSQLLLEQSAWSALSRVEKLAASELAMKVPDPKDVVIVRK